MNKQNRVIEVGLIVIEKKAEPLSKDQITFNNLINKIQELEKKILLENEKNETILQEFSKTVTPLQKKFYESQFDSAKLLAKAFAGLSISDKQRAIVEDVILWLCKNSFKHVPPTEDKIKFYNEWAFSNYHDEVQESGKDYMHSIADDIKNQFGFDVDVSDLENTPEGHAILKERLKDLLEKESNDNPFPNEKIKINNPKILSVKEQEKLKSIRAVYIGLAKLLHPDLALKAEDKLVREELMKQVTIAYNEKDLTTLLKIELEWATKNKDFLRDIPNQKIKLYIANLKDQARGLEMKLRGVFANPRFEEIGQLTMMQESRALHEIKIISAEMKQRLQATKKIQDFIKNYPPKKDLLNYVKEVKNQIDDITQF